MNVTLASEFHAIESQSQPQSSSYDILDLAKTPTIAPTSMTNFTPAPTFMDAEELHEEDAYAAVILNVVLIICVLLAYWIKEKKIYFLPERWVSERVSQSEVQRRTLIFFFELLVQVTFVCFWREREELWCIISIPGILYTTRTCSEEGVKEMMRCLFVTKYVFTV